MQKARTVSSRALHMCTNPILLVKKSPNFCNFSNIFMILKNPSPLQQRFFWVGGWVFILPQKPLCFLMPGIFCKACCIGLGKHALHWLGLDMLCFTKSLFWCWVAKPMGHGMHNTILDAKPSACNIRIVGHTHTHTQIMCWARLAASKSLFFYQKHVPL